MTSSPTAGRSRSRSPSVLDSRSRSRIRSCSRPDRRSSRSRSRSHSRARSLLYKLKFAQSKKNEAYKAVGIACDALDAKNNTAGGMFSQGEKEAWEAARTTARTASYEQQRAHDAVIDSVRDSQADTRDARSHKAVITVELKAAHAESHKLMKRLSSQLLTRYRQKEITAEMCMDEFDLEQHTDTNRLAAARARRAEAEDEIEATFVFSEFLLEGRLAI